MPRSKADIRLGAAVGGDGGDDGDGDAGGGGGGDGADEGAAGGGGRRSGVDAADSPEAATFAELADHTDRMVRVGGRLEGADGPRLHLHDGTASGIVRLPDDSVEFVSSLVVGEVVNVTGRVRQRDDEQPEVVARSLADIQRAASLPDSGGGGSEAIDPVEMIAAGPDAPEAPASDLDAALDHSGTRTDLPIPILAALAALLLSGVVGIVGGTALVLWRRRAAAGEAALSRPAPIGR